MSVSRSDLGLYQGSGRHGLVRIGFTIWRVPGEEGLTGGEPALCLEWNNEQTNQTTDAPEDGEKRRLVAERKRLCTVAEVAGTGDRLAAQPELQTRQG